MKVRDYSDDSKEIDTEKCKFCTGYSAVWLKDHSRRMTSKEYCEEVTTCSATIDWEKVFGVND